MCRVGMDGFSVECITLLTMAVLVFGSASGCPKCWLSQGDIILVGLRDYQDEKADVILKCAP